MKAQSEINGTTLPYGRGGLPPEMLLGYLDRIAVRPPYLALDLALDVRSFKREVVARVGKSHPLGSEREPIAAAEAGRHMAIAGAIAASMENPKAGKHYYLARHALLTRSDAEFVLFSGTRIFEIRVGQVTLAGRSASAVVKLAPFDGPTLFSLNIDYEVLSGRLFEKLFSKFEHGREDGWENDEFMNILPQPVLLEEPAANKISAYYDVVAEHCHGHFPRYPSLPVAKLMHMLSNLAGTLLGRILAAPNTTYDIVRADVTATQLAFAGSKVHFTVEYLGATESGDYSFKCNASSSEGSSYGEMICTLRRSSCTYS